jgi:hypothetical protein
MGLSKEGVGGAGDCYLVEKRGIVNASSHRELSVLGPLCCHFFFEHLQDVCLSCPAGTVAFQPTDGA